MIVVVPCRPGGALGRGIFVGPGNNRKGVPLIMLVVPTGGSPWTWMLVGVGTAMNGVPSMIVKLPVRPGGAFATGIFVAEGITMNSVPPILVEVCVKSFGWADGAAKVVGPVMTKKGVLLIIVVDAPVTSSGAFTTGISVAEGITISGVPFIIVTLAPGMTSGGEVDEGAKVMGAETIINVDPSMVVVCPGRPAGAAPIGIVVGFRTIPTLDEESPLFSGSSGVFVGQLPII
jgi:hypothetical protein